MAKVKYIGPFAAVEIVDDGQLVTIRHNGEYEVSEKDAKWLCQQPDNWKLIEDKQASGKKAGD